MWRKDDGNPQPPSGVAPQPASTQAPTKPGTSPLSTPVQTSHTAAACISQGIKIKGEITGSEDLFIDGKVDGKVTVSKAVVTVGPNGIAKADITAKELVFRGVAEGKFTAEERIQIWHTAKVHGELKSERISIEDGAELRGKVEAGKASNKAAAAAASETPGRNKKVEQTNSNSSTKDASVAPDAATAGAD
jgi:cytoskeletal protein CcmA (bactofilin family)